MHLQFVLFCVFFIFFGGGPGVRTVGRAVGWVVGGGRQTVGRAIGGGRQRSAAGGMWRAGAGTDNGRELGRRAVLALAAG